MKYTHIITIAGEDFETAIDQHRVSSQGFEMSFGVDFVFKSEDQRRLGYAVGLWTEQKSDIQIRSIEESA